MTHKNFAYWLQGYNEISGGERPSEEGWRVIQDHLALTFNKVTPNRTRQIYDPTNLPATQTYCTSRPGFGPFPGIRGDTVPVLTKGIVKLQRKRNCGDTEITYHNLPLHSLPMTMSTC